ncbi:Uncharacterized protein OS=Pontibacter sp. BAB1700 GN=O71_00842 PE=4 SV=1 [Tuwongella immobilis]|uniref:Uncharacterized protein n=2 Tax=Tuwongella immobilis TaxID=692036 RepID=A0A6C2YMR6_9BACT|nr:Uncharacterized protein OS=Pontibacter sp. BAB1700 GN=O71_00842 PE=4 SV=1 [Tuwongella immobilis]VTS02758.1 Uncharacterized protein OS=Pontibacter sp. BAB1700 GN=O71_00842 PE=4 SV=1 [Tuwongella immobilis]
MSSDHRASGAASHEPAIEYVEGVDYTVEYGCVVFTALGLLKRGYCCDNGCRNCPYSPTATPPKRDLPG